jgi:hypothetical protein
MALRYIGSSLTEVVLKSRNRETQIRNSEKCKHFGMQRTLILNIALIILLCVLASGCITLPGTDTPATPVPSPAQTTEPVTLTTTPTMATTTLPVQALPPERQVNLVLTKDRPTSEIHLLFQGGPGEMFIQRIMMRVYTSGTGYEEYVMSSGKKPIPGDEIIAPGTRGDDRCEVFIISAGTRYKVMDEPAIAGGYY